MKLITKAIADAAPALYANEGQSLGDQKVIAKFFDPTGRYEFYMLEYNAEDRLAFGWTVSPLGPDCDELGYASIDEMEEVKGAFGLGIERDTSFTPKPFRDVADTLSPGRV
jgi:hypothetical protein